MKKINILGLLVCLFYVLSCSNSNNNTKHISDFQTTSHFKIENNSGVAVKVITGNVFPPNTIDLSNTKDYHWLAYNGEAVWPVLNENKTKVYFDETILVEYDQNDVSERNPGSISNYKVGLDELGVDYFVYIFTHEDYQNALTQKK